MSDNRAVKCTTIAIRLTPAQKRKVQAVAAATARTVSSLLCELVDRIRVEQRPVLVLDRHAIGQTQDQIVA